MEGLFFLVGCLLLAFPILAIVALVKTVGLSARLGSLEYRLAAIEGQPPRAAAAAVMPKPIPTAPPPVDAAPPVSSYTTEPFASAEPEQAAPPPPPTEAPPPSAVPPIPPPAAAPAQLGISFEELLGTQWTVWVGGIA